MNDILNQEFYFVKYIRVQLVRSYCRIQDAKKWIVVLESI